MHRIEIPWRSPLDAFAPLARRAGAVLLHGGERASDAPWSFVAAEPRSIIERRQRETRVDEVLTDLSPFEALRRAHLDRRLPSAPPPEAPFMTGLIGFAGYECAPFVEPGAPTLRSPYETPDFWFGAYDAVAAFDRRRRRAFVVGRAQATAARFAAMIGDDGAGGTAADGAMALIGSNFTKDDYCAAVDEIIGRIRRGDLFQANISQRLTLAPEFPVDPFDLFRNASARSSAAFGAFLSFGDAAILSLSPERFFRVEAGVSGARIIRAEPIKGTRPRSDDPAEDARLLAALTSDAKDRAENIMIADLTRNDLSRICDDYSIREEAICEAVSHASVHHLVSRISGRLRDDVNAVDALTTMFPCGSVTGAPKVEAMRVIADIERSGRGPYCGAIGYMDDRGGADFSVAIRLAIAEGGKFIVPVGGGITLRSDPQAEYDETLDKAAHWLRLPGPRERRAS